MKEILTGLFVRCDIGGGLNLEIRCFTGGWQLEVRGYTIPVTGATGWCATHKEIPYSIGFIDCYICFIV